MSVEERIEKLERETSRWKVLCSVQLVVFLGLLIFSWNRAQTTVHAGDGILHARGLIIEDANGRARILLGAPFPETHDRLRQDVRTEAMIFLDDHGHDRVSLGEEVPVQQNGKVPSGMTRIAPGFGFIIHDPEGNERGGLGFLQNRAVMALDRPNGDAWAAMVDDKNGFAGTLSIYDRTVGDGAEGIFTGTQGKRAFIALRGLDDLPRAEFSIGADQKASFEVFNSLGKEPHELLNGPQKP